LTHGVYNINLNFIKKRVGLTSVIRKQLQINKTKNTKTETKTNTSAQQVQSEICEGSTNATRKTTGERISGKDWFLSLE